MIFFICKEKSASELIEFAKENGIEKTAKSYETICNFIQSELKW